MTHDGWMHILTFWMHTKIMQYFHHEYLFCNRMPPHAIMIIHNAYEIKKIWSGTFRWDTVITQLKNMMKKKNIRAGKQYRKRNTFVVLHKRHTRVARKCIR